jgi:hypothetical protein
MPFVALRWLDDGMDLTDEAEEAGGGLKARMGLAKAQPQPLWLLPTPPVDILALPSVAVESQYEDEEEPNKPEHLILILCASTQSSSSSPNWPGSTILLDLLLWDSRWDSTRLNVQSPNPFESRSKKSPEKLLLPQPTDRDLATFLPKDDDEAWLWLPPGLGLSSSPITAPKCASLFAGPSSSVDPMWPWARDDEKEETDLLLIAAALILDVPPAVAVLVVVRGEAPVPVEEEEER